MTRVAADPVLKRLKNELQSLYGPRLKQILLYGSRARGDYRDDSDYDVLVVVEPPLEYWPEVHRLSSLSSRFMWDTIDWENPVDLSLRPTTPEGVQARTGFMHNVRREAVEL